MESSSLANSYARGKAMAAFEIAKRAAAVNSRACFKVKAWERYIPLIASGHEMIRTAAKLADNAREIDKGEDSVVRKPHYTNGLIGVKKKLIEK